MTARPQRPTADLHNHLGAAVRPTILWSIAHSQGIRLPTKDYFEFEQMITMSGDERNRNLQEMNDRFFHWTELIQSSPLAIEESVKAVIAGGYRKSNIVLHELRFNPMKRNRGGERDLDHIIMSAVWGMDRALLEYPQAQAGLILMMDRSFPYELNEIIVRKAVRYVGRGVVGIDLGGPDCASFSMREHRPLFQMARRAGLGVTVHTGEEGRLEEMEYVVRDIRPDRIGHGVQAARDPKLLASVARRGIVLEVCPTSNLRNSVFADVDELRQAFRAIADAGVPFVVCTDGPEMYRTTLRQEQDFLVRNGILTPAEIARSNRLAFAASFVGRRAAAPKVRPPVRREAARVRV